MFLESLIRLAQIVDHFKTNNQILISDKFQKETEELIAHQTKFLITELEFKKNNPGPYVFGFGNLHIIIFSPDETEEQEWAAIVRNGNEQKNYRFNSIMGLIKVLIMAIQENNSSTIEQDSQSKTEN